MKKEKRWLRYLLVLVSIWVSVTSTVQSFKDPTLTEMQLFKLIPETALLKFK